MPTGDKLYYLPHKEIDRSLWDACIDKAPNGLIYAKSYYLDEMANTWNAVIWGDYQAVMPLPWKRKYFFKYVYPPPFLQQLGVFSRQQLPSAIVLKMIQTAESKFKFGEYFFNFQNVFQNTNPKTNFILNLEKDYKKLAANYHQNLQRNLKKAAKLNLQYACSNDFKAAIHLYQSTYGKRMPHVTEVDYRRLTNACQVLYKREELVIRETRDKEGNLLALLLCLKDRNRIYFLLPTTTERGRKCEANHFMIDNLIKEFAGQKLVLDFEGSDLPGIAHFYKNFGSSNQPYFFYRWNHLPWPLNLIKDR